MEWWWFIIQAIIFIPIGMGISRLLSMAKKIKQIEDFLYEKYGLELKP